MSGEQDHSRTWLGFWRGQAGWVRQKVAPERGTAEPAPEGHSYSDSPNKPDVEVGADRPRKVGLCG